MSLKPSACERPKSLGSYTFVAAAFVLLVALEHFAFFALQSLLWETSIGRAVFGTSSEQAKGTAVLAMQQGFYNGLLAFGLLWGLWRDSRETVLLFLSFVMAAGMFGGVTVNFFITMLQAVPAAVAMIFFLIFSPHKKA